MVAPDSPSDPAAFDPEGLVRHGRFVKALARELAHDEDEADELAARTMAEAIARRPDDGPGLRVWLRRVASRLFARTRRDSERRRRRDFATAASRETELPATVDVVARIELERDVAECFAALEEPYRTTLFLRYFDDVPPREIAARMSVPVETVRTRTKRGLARLRAALDERHGQRRNRWRAIAVSLASGGGATVMALKSKVAIAAGIAALVVGAAGWRFELAAGRVETGADDSPAPLAATAAERSAPRAAPESAAASPVVARVEELPFASGVVVDGAGAPIADVAVVASRLLEFERGKLGQMTLDLPFAERDLLARTDAGGSFAIAELPADVVALFFVKAGCAAAEWSDFSPARAENQERRIVLGPGFRIAGRVHDSEGRPIPRACVSVNSVAATGESRVARHLVGTPRYVTMVGWMTQRTVGDEEGRFELTSIPARPFWFWCSIPGYHHVTLGDRELADPIEVRLERSGTILDVSDAESGRPLVDARACVLLADSGEVVDAVATRQEESNLPALQPPAVPGRLFLWNEHLIRSKGRKNGAGVEVIAHVFAPNHASADVRVSMQTGVEPAHLRVPLARDEGSPSLSGRVVGADHARVAVLFIPSHVSNMSAQNTPPLAVCETGDDGTFRFRDLPAADYALLVSAPGCTPRWPTVKVPAQDVTIQLAPAARLEVHVVNRAGVSQPDVTVHVQSADELRAWSRHTDAEGIATLDGLPDGRLHVVAVPGLSYSADSDVVYTVDRRCLSESDTVVLVPGECTQVERCIPERLPVVLRAVHQDGSVVEGVEILLRGLVRGLGGVDAKTKEGGLHFKTFTTDVRGEVHLDAYPGTYQMDVTAAGRNAFHEVLVPPDGGTVDLVVPDEQGTAIVRGRVTELGHPETPVIGRPVYAWTETPSGERASVQAVTDSDGAFELTNVLVGNVSIHAAASASPGGTYDESSPYRQVSRTVQLAPDQELEVSLSVPLAAEPDLAADVATIEVTIVDEATGDPVSGAELHVSSVADGNDYDLASIESDREGRATRRVPAMNQYSLEVIVGRSERGQWSETFERQQVEVTPVDGRVRAVVRLRRAAEHD